MHRSLSKLLQETQATAAKKLGVLENTHPEDNLDQDGLTDLLQDAQPLQSSGARGTKAQGAHEQFTLREFQIW